MFKLESNSSMTTCMGLIPGLHAGHPGACQNRFTGYCLQYSPAGALAGGLRPVAATLAQLPPPCCLGGGASDAGLGTAAAGGAATAGLGPAAAAGAPADAGHWEGAAVGVGATGGAAAGAC